MSYRFFFLMLPLLLSLTAGAQFTERALEKGVDHTYLSLNFFGGGVAVFDMNNDLLPDLYFTGGISGDKLYINNGNGFDRKVTYLWPEDFEYFDLNTMGVVGGDVNNDGWDDIFLCTDKGVANLLMINNGDNTFDAIPPEESGITERGWSVSASFGDINLDGLLDILVANYVDTIRQPETDSNGVTIFTHAGYRNYLYINEGDNVFREASEEYGMTLKGTSLACTFTDYDNDADPDLYIVNDFGHFIVPNELYRNNHPSAVLEDVSASSGADIGLFGMGIAIGDYDNDLDLDYYMTNIGRNALLSNEGDGTFRDRTYTTGVSDSATTQNEMKAGWSTGFLDYNNDGFLDIYVSNGFIFSAEDIANATNSPNSLFRNEGDGTFLEIARGVGIADPSPCRGGAFADLDDDGDLDMIFIPVNTSFNPDPDLREEVLIYYNEMVSSSHWVKFKLVGDSANRNGYGAHVLVYDNTGRIQMREADGGSGHASSNGPFIHFGLGAAEGIDSVAVIWPGGKRTSYLDLQANDTYLLEETLSVVSGTANPTTQKLLIHPNPTNGQVAVQLPEQAAGWREITLEIRDSEGRQVLRKQPRDQKIWIDLSAQPSGAYYFILSGSSEERALGTVIKQ